MKALPILAGMTAMALAGCHKLEDADGSRTARPGRYNGVGIYQADRAWTHMSAADKPDGKARATVADDRAVIVVVDSRTGELRQCGNLSGYCIGMNPWERPLGRDRILPVELSEHANDAAAANVADDAPPEPDNAGAR